MRRAFTLVEILSVLAIAGILGAISFPVFYRVKRSAAQSTCLSNLHQLGVALALYQSDYHGRETGTPSEMGLPPNLGYLDLKVNLRCGGINPDGDVAGYHIAWPNPQETTKEAKRVQADWAGYTALYGPAAVVLSDPNHQEESGPRSYTWQSWRVLGLRLDGSAFTRRRMGYPKGWGWWHKP